MELLIFVLFGAGSTYYLWHRSDQVWKAVAEEGDFVYTNPLFGSKSLYGHLRGFEVRIEEVSDDEADEQLVVKVRGVDSGFTLGRDRVEGARIASDVETGDESFDERVRIEGDPDWALALLDEEARRLAETVVSHWRGELDEWYTLIVPVDKIESTVSMLDTLLDLARRLRRPEHAELPRLLVERARHDPSDAVRLQAFRRLVSSAFGEEAHAVAETLLGSSSASLRLEACRLLVGAGPEDSDRAIEELISLAARRQTHYLVRCSALETLAESRHGASGIPVMSQILRDSGSSRVRMAALEGLIRVGAKAELLEIETYGEDEAEILARGLGRFDASVQPRLIQLLEDSGDRVRSAVRSAAARSLGEVGDLEAIRHLRKVAGKDRFFESSLAREAERAIESIKARSEGSQQGEISIVTVAPLEGAISSSDDSETGGEVSLTP